MDKKGENNVWYVLQTRSRHEKKVFDFLTRSQIEVFLPLVTRRKQWSDRVKFVIEPLFSGYIFVQFKEEDRYLILNTSGVVRLISFEGKYASILPEKIEAIRSIIFDNEGNEIIDLNILPGEEVLITHGHFKGFFAKLVNFKGKDKLLLEVEAIGKGVLLEIGKNKIKKLKQGIID